METQTNSMFLAPIPDRIELGSTTMIHILKSNRWTGYAALICAAVVTSLLWIDAHAHGETLAAIMTVYCLAPLGAYFAVRGLFVGSLPSRICSGLALVFFGWMLYSLIAGYTNARIR
jgi:hypothetical protein